MVYITSLFALVILSLLDSSQAKSVIREHVLSEDEAEASTMQKEGAHTSTTSDHDSDMKISLGVQADGSISEVKENKGGVHNTADADRDTGILYAEQKDTMEQKDKEAADADMDSSDVCGSQIRLDTKLHNVWTERLDTEIHNVSLRLSQFIPNVSLQPVMLCDTKLTQWREYYKVKLDVLWNALFDKINETENERISCEKKKEEEKKLKDTKDKKCTIGKCLACVDPEKKSKGWGWFHRVETNHKYCVGNGECWCPTKGSWWNGCGLGSATKIVDADQCRTQFCGKNLKEILAKKGLGETFSAMQAKGTDSKSGAVLINLPNGFYIKEVKSEGDDVDEYGLLQKRLRGPDGKTSNPLIQELTEHVTQSTQPQGESRLLHIYVIFKTSFDSKKIFMFGNSYKPMSKSDEAVLKDYEQGRNFGNFYDLKGSWADRKRKPGESGMLKDQDFIEHDNDKMNFGTGVGLMKAVNMSKRIQKGIYYDVDFLKKWHLLDYSLLYWHGTYKNKIFDDSAAEIDASTGLLKFSPGRGVSEAIRSLMPTCPADADSTKIQEMLEKTACVVLAPVLPCSKRFSNKNTPVLPCRNDSPTKNSDMEKLEVYCFGIIDYLTPFSRELSSPEFYKKKYRAMTAKWWLAKNPSTRPPDEYADRFKRFMFDTGVEYPAPHGPVIRNAERTVLYACKTLPAPQSPLPASAPAYSRNQSNSRSSYEGGFWSRGTSSSGGGFGSKVGSVGRKLRQSKVGQWGKKFKGLFN